MTRDHAEIFRYLEPAELAAVPSGFSPEQRAVLEAVNQKIAARQSVEEIIDFLFQATRPLSPCDRIGLAFVEEDGARVVSYYSNAAYEPLLLAKGYAEDLRGSSLQTVIERGVPRIIHDLERYLEIRPDSNSTRLLLREGVRSSMTCPLTVDGRPAGLLFRSARTPGAYDTQQVRLHAAVAERLSQAVEKAYLIERLQAANRDYYEMLGFVSHELKAPVASIVQSAQLLTDGYLGALTPEQRDRLQRMIAKGEHLLNLVRDYLNLSRLEGGESLAEPRPVADVVGEVIEPAVDLVQPQIDARRMRLVRNFPAEPCPARLDPELLRIVLVNLLSNAAKYGRDEGQIRLTVEPAERELRLAVWNEGPGFPPQERGRLFRKFSRLQTPELLKQKGTGVGLYTCWRIVQLHGGRIEARSTPGEWAEFSCAIPQPLIGGLQSG